MTADVSCDPVTVAEQGLAELSAAGLHVGFGAHLHLAGAARVFTVAVGKAAAAATSGLRKALPVTLLRASLVVDHLGPGSTRDTVAEAPSIVHLRGDHPVPGQRSADAAQQLAEVVAGWRLTAHDVVVVSISGGTSALIAAPVPPLTVSELTRISATLLGSGIDVTEANTVRRRVGRLHDGGLTRLLRPARVFTSVLSDNAQERVAAVGSGPTVPDPRPTSLAALHALPTELRSRVLMAIGEGRLPGETADAVTVIAGMRDYTAACARVAERLGHATDVVAPVVEGSWESLAVHLWELASAAKPAGSAPRAVLGCGEVEVVVRPEGTGGRCQQVALAVALSAPPGVEFRFAAYASDGRDHLDGVRGAVVDHRSATWLRSHGGAEALKRTDAHHVLRGAGCLLEGPATGENLGDAYVLCLPSRGRR